MYISASNEMWALCMYHCLMSYIISVQWESGAYCYQLDMRLLYISIQWDRSPTQTHTLAPKKGKAHTNIPASNEHEVILFRYFILFRWCCFSLTFEYCGHGGPAKRREKIGREMRGVGGEREGKRVEERRAVTHLLLQFLSSSILGQTQTITSWVGVAITIPTTQN